jgi:hypothetical protein
MPDYRISDTGHRLQQQSANSSSKSSNNVVTNGSTHSSIVSSSDRKTANVQHSAAPGLLLDVEGVRSLRQQQQQAAAAAAAVTIRQHDQQAKHVSGTCAVSMYCVAIVCV